MKNRAWNRRVEDRIRSFLLKKRIRVVKTTRPAALAEFFSSIRPVATDHALIRIGGDGDGGYLLPDDLEGIDVCFSPGVSDVANFEEELIRRNIKSYLADHSVDGPPVPHALLDFEKKFLGQQEDDVFMTLESWVRRKAPSGDDMILQMDIEGAEYGVIFDTSSETLKRFRVIVIEFHRLNELVLEGRFDLYRMTFAKLLKDFDVVHMHPNNYFEPLQYQGFSIPPLMEFTFLRKDRVSRRSAITDLPHRLDKRNVAGNEDPPLDPCWYRR
jgi:hypothetical protein